MYCLGRNAQYLQYMESRLGSAGRSLRKGQDNCQSLDHYRHSKLLPHINQQYEFRITNRLLLQKIINPRRDKKIVQSLSRTAVHLCVRKKKAQAMQNAQLSIGRKPYSQFAQPNSSSTHQSYDKPRASLGLHKNNSNKKFERENSCRPDPVSSQLQSESKEKIQESSWGQTQTSSLRDNYIGKIVRNKTSRMIRNQRRQILNNIHDNIQGVLSQSLFTESQENQSIRVKPRQVKIKRIVRGYQKQNQIQQLFETFTVF